MLLNETGIGTRLEVELVDKNREKVGNTYVSQIFEHISENVLVILSPIFESRLIYISVNADMHIVFFHKKYGLMSFYASVISRETRGNIAILAIRAESDVEAIQRRENYRLTCNIDGGYIVKDSNSTEDFDSDAAKSNNNAMNNDTMYKKTLTKNISGSGVCIISEENIPINTHLEVYLDISASVRIKAQCVVLRNNPVKVKKTTFHELGLHFTKISQRDQNYIIKYIFEQQRVLLKKESAVIL
jgi:c-di-GMP-binding flagellar brake protein YcgR